MSCSTPRQQRTKPQSSFSWGQLVPWVLRCGLSQMSPSDIAIQPQKVPNHSAWDHSGIMQSFWIQPQAVMDVYVCPCSTLSSCKFHWFIYWKMRCFPPKCPLFLGSNFASQLSHSKEKGSSVGPLWAASPVLWGFSCISLRLLHRFDKFLDFFFQGFVPPLNILPGALHIAEADLQGCRLLLFLLQFFIEPHHLSPDVIIFLLKATRKERNEWKNWVLPLDSPFSHPPLSIFLSTSQDPYPTCTTYLCPNPHVSIS